MLPSHLLAPSGWGIALSHPSKGAWLGTSAPPLLELQCGPRESSPPNPGTLQPRFIIISN